MTLREATAHLRGTGAATCAVVDGRRATWPRQIVKDTIPHDGFADARARASARPLSASVKVLPASALARKHFWGAAMALALTLWGLCGWSAA